MFIYILFLLVSSDDFEEFDRFERRHYDNENCEQAFTVTNGAITISSFDGVPPYALRDCTNIQTVTINGVPSIPEYTFYGSTIKRVTITSTTPLTIGIGAFAHCTSLESITLPTTVTTINEGAFFHAGTSTSLLNLEPLNDLSTIGNSAFEESPLINGVYKLGTKPETLTIGNRAFYGTKITELTIPTIASIGEYAFASCSTLTKLASLNVGTINAHAFSDSPLSGDLAITTTFVGEHAFSSTAATLKITGLAQRTTGTSDIRIGEFAFSGKIIACSLSYISETATQIIAPYAFYRCTFEAANQNINLQNVNIGDFAFANSTFNNQCGLTLYKSVVGPHAFECTKGTGPLVLSTSLDFDDNDITFSEYAFYHSTVLTTGNNPLYLSNAPYKSFSHCTGLTRALTFIGTEIGHYAFANCTGLAGPVLINGASVGQSAFEFCTSLTKINITANYKEQETDPDLEIGNRAFYGCTALNAELILHQFIGSIGEYAFGRCTGLRDTPITIYSDVIHPYAFAECTTLNGPIKIYSTTISFHSFDKNTLGTLTIDSKFDREGETPNVQNEAFYNLRFTGPVVIKDHVVVNDYAFIYCTFANRLLIDADSVGRYSFSQCNASNNCNVSIGETTIAEHAFEFFGRHQNPITLEFHVLKEATTSNEIGEAAFNTTGFTNQLVIPNFYTGIDSQAFYNCPRIPSVSINFGHQSDILESAYIGVSAFEGCAALNLLSIKSAVCTYDDGGNIQQKPLNVYIYSRAFYGTGINHEFVMPLTISSIGASAFEECRQLRGVVFNYNTPGSFSISSRAFCNCENLRGEVYIPSGVSSIESYAFANCSQLNRLTLVLEGSLTSIGDYAFYGCTNLEGSLDIPYEVTEIGSYAFYNCQRLGEHLSVRAIKNGQRCSLGNNAFERCRNLKTLDFLPNTDTNNVVYQKLTSIGAECFINTGLLCDLNIPYSLRTIGDRAFQGSTLGRLLANDDNNYALYSIGESAFQDSTISGDLIIPPSLYYIYEHAFENCRNLGSIVFEETHNGHDLEIREKAFYQSSVRGDLDIPNYVYRIGESAFENCQLASLTFSHDDEDLDYINYRAYDLNVNENAFKGTTITGSLRVNSRSYVVDSTTYNPSISFSDSVFANCEQIENVFIVSGDFGYYTFENCTMLRSFGMSGGTISAYSFRGCVSLNGTIRLSSCTVGSLAFADFQYNNITLSISSSSSGVSFGYRAFYNSSLTGYLYLNNYVSSIGQEAFAECKNLLNSLYVGASQVGANAFRDSVFDGSLSISFSTINTYPKSYGEGVFKGCTGFTDLDISGDENDATKSIPDYAFTEIPFTGTLSIYKTITNIGKYAFQGCGFYAIDLHSTDRTTADLVIQEGAFSNCNQINTTVDISKCKFDSNTLAPRIFAGCQRLPSVIFPTNTAQNKVIKIIGNEAFSGCSSLSIHPDFFLDLTKIGKHSFQGCRSIRGEMYVPTTLAHIDEYAFADCKGLSGRLTIHVNPTSYTYIGPSAFKGCSGFKDGKLYIFINANEEQKYIIGKDQSAPFRPYYKYDYFLTLGNEAFEDTKFKTVYYSGRFQPECDYDIGFSHTKGIHTSSNYVNKTFCNYPLHSSKLSGGAIAGITIAVIVVVAAIVILILFLICRNKKRKDNSEDEVEMNQDP